LRVRLICHTQEMKKYSIFSMPNGCFALSMCCP
jgi:hypothetical protein